MKTCLVALSAVIFAVSCSAKAEELKLASWNVANLASKPNTALRGHERTEAEFQHIRDIVSKLSPDIIALQEMGSSASAKAILGEGYAVVFEKRCMDNSVHCEEDVDDIFTGIAYKKSLGQLEQILVPELAVLHTSECANEPPREVRGGVGLNLTKDGKQYVILSVHLKASCKNNNSESSPDQADDCATLNKQVDILIDWMQTQKAAGKVVIVAGDFNRELINGRDRVAQKFKAFDPSIRFEPSSRQCWAAFQRDGSAIIKAANEKFPEIAEAGGRPLPFSPKSNAKIDYFVISGSTSSNEITSDQYPMGGEANTTEEATDYLKTCEGKPNKFDDGSVLAFSEVEPSDHCPISMTIPRP